MNWGFCPMISRFCRVKNSIEVVLNKKFLCIIGCKMPIANPQSGHNRCMAPNMRKNYSNILSLRDRNIFTKLTSSTSSHLVGVMAPSEIS